MQHFWEFLKNFGLVGGLGLIVLAPRTLPVSEVVQHTRLHPCEWASGRQPGDASSLGPIPKL
jgi:hypothetical protein